MAGKEKQMIVIKKITVAGAGHHGGSWKVALADFMTALMAFFLVMWLLGQSEETKKAVSDYFSTPSVIEYNFKNYGAQITLEKLFLDLVNEPMKAFESFMEPMDKTPNLLDMGSAKVVAAFLADQLGEEAQNVKIDREGLDFDIPENLLFEKGTAKPNSGFIEIVEKIKGITTGLEDAVITLKSVVATGTLDEDQEKMAMPIAQERLDLISNKIKASLEHTSVDISGSTSVVNTKNDPKSAKKIGFVRLSVKQKEFKSNGQKQRKIETVFGDPKAELDVYDNFVNQLANKKTKAAKKAKE
ncbi:MAG: chemotaxis protein MotB [Bdellovibrionaceae bacterium]|nr:chemotaxis protein MotB [Pseudobdellovibrionaceae bacterium]NUM59527.1 chemotaxis protein MotB [Pseudobdellovibrionaceae bacterium]